MLRVWLDDIKSKEGCQCGEKHPACLEFHHLDPSKKDDEISTMLKNGCSKESILTEIQKCLLMCSNCHKKLHYKEKCDKIQLQR